jgi:hypothetical protein
MSSKKRLIVIWIAAQLLGFSVSAHAYLDPGTGSILVQSLLAGIAGAAAVISLYWQRLKRFFVGFRKHSNDDARPSAPPTDNEHS